MTSLMARNIFSLFKLPVVQYVPQTSTERLVCVSAALQRARKGTREKALKKKVKVEVKKVGFIPHSLRSKGKLKEKPVDRHAQDTRPTSLDDVYALHVYRRPLLTVGAAIECHKQTHHPSIYNEPDAYINVLVELNMQGEKKTRFLDGTSRLATIPHGYLREEQRNILVLCKGQELQQEARDAGAALVAGPEFIKSVQGGTVNLEEYDTILAHPNIVTDLVPLRGLMKRKFPMPKVGTVGTDLKFMIKRFKDGIHYKVIKDEQQPNFGSVQTSFGRLNMPTEQLEENFIALIKDLNNARPKRSGLYITRCYLLSPPSVEKLQVDPFVFIPSGVVSEVEELEEEPEVAIKEDDADSDSDSDTKERKTVKA